MQLLNVGNTRITAAEYEGEIIRNIRSTLTRDYRIPEGDELILAASVVPKFSDRLVRRGNVFLLQNIHAAACGLDLSAVDASTLGADRLANAIELVCQAKLPAMTIDLGTAINCEIVDRNGFFRGGAIAPGRRMMLQSLYGGTAQLPELSVRQELREMPGTNTRETIFFGVDQAVAGMIRRWIGCVAEMLHEMPRVVAIGGDAPLYIPLIPELESGGEDFTLRGLLRGWDRSLPGLAHRTGGEVK